MTKETMNQELNHKRVAAFTTLAPSCEDTSIVNVPETLKQYINGIWEDGVGVINSINPASGELLYTLPRADASAVNRAVECARAALPGWAALSGADRGKVLYRIARRILEEARMLAVAESMDGGKPIRETREVDIPLAAQHFFYHAGWCDKLEVAGLGPDVKPIGVIGQIIPWNFPLLMLAWKIAPAIALGNTVVLKPSETTSLTAHLLTLIMHESGLPAGVVNIIYGDGPSGELLAGHPGVDKIAFTGSTEVGKLIMKSTAGTNRKLTLELGGKGANIVCKDANIYDAIEGVVSGIFFNQGHVCCAGSRLLIDESIHDNFVELLKERVAKIIVGNPLDKNVEMGAINSKEQLCKIETLVNGAVSAGAKLETSVYAPEGRGYYYPPTILTGVHPSDKIAQIEVFGPVLTVSTFKTDAEAVLLANNTPYGLATGIWTNNPDKAAWMAGNINSGVIWINTYNVFDPSAAFGGFKESGFGREGGRVGLEAYCE